MSKQAVTRAKILVHSVSETKDDDGNTTQENISANAVYSDDPESENKQWSKWTPALSLSMSINNPGAFGKLEAGKEYFLDFIPVK